MIKRVKDLNGLNHSIDIDKDLEWLAPYIMEAKRAGVPIWRIEKIVGYYVPLDKVENQHAAIIKDGNKKATITILKKRQVYSSDNGVAYASGYEDAHKKYHFEFTLNSLAHELSHIVYWEHNADRFIEEARLFKRFASLSKRLGYKGYKG